MEAKLFIQKGGTLILCGSRIKASDIKRCLCALTDLSGAIHSFAIRFSRHERPRRKLIIEVELNRGYDPGKYNENPYIYELIKRMKELSRGFREYIRVVPLSCFPEMRFNAYRSAYFSVTNTQIERRYFIH